MGQIQSSIGLVSGINFATTINALMAVDTLPKNALATANSNLTAQETAVNQLAALLLEIQSSTTGLANSQTFTQQTASSSNSNALTATVTGQPSTGSYVYTPLRTVQSQQFLSSGYASETNPIGAGTLTFRFGSTVAPGASLSNINGGAGFAPGKIQITDRSGATATIDLSTAQNIDDVVNAIDSAGNINVTAVADGDHLELIDHTGQTASNLKVQEVGTGSTAASLGLAGINTSSSAANGQDILKLYGGINLSALNDGTGIQTNTILPDIQYTLHDGTTGTIDLSPIISGSAAVQKETTLNQIIQEVNTQSNGKLQLSIASGGQGLVATDTTSGVGSFSLSAINGSGALQDLGLAGAASGSTISGNQIIGGLKSVLLSSLNGGQGLGALGSLNLTDRNGANASVNLSGAVTLNDVIDAINTQAAAANVDVTAAVNQSGDGIQLTDTSGGSGNLIAANGSDGNKTADKLGITASASTASIQGQDLHLQVVSLNTTLSNLNGGAGVAQGTFTITDSSGANTKINLSSASIVTVGDAINAINAATPNVHAQINSTGDGIVLEDTANGAGTLEVTEGSSTTAHDLHLLGTATTITQNNVTTQQIDGSTTQTIQVSNTDTLTDLQNKINQSGGGITANILSDGSSTPFRLILSSTQSGSTGNLVVDASQLGSLSLQETTHGQNALIALGNAANPASSTLISSSTNNFTNVLPGATLQILSASQQPVTINISASDSSIASSLSSFVSAYNNFRSQLGQDTAFDTTTNTPSVLSNDSTALALDTNLANLISGSILGTGSIQSLAQLGVTINTDGTLTFKQATLDSAFASNPNSVQQFFTAKTIGFANQFNTLINQIAGQTGSVISARVNALQSQINDNQNQINIISAELTNEQNVLYTTFDNMEVAISGFKNSLNVINAIAPLDFPGLSSNSSNSG